MLDGFTNIKGKITEVRCDKLTSTLLVEVPNDLKKTAFTTKVDITIPRYNAIEDFLVGDLVTITVKRG